MERRKKSKDPKLIEIFDVVNSYLFWYITIMLKSGCSMAKPFLKWAGGKTQLLNSLYQRLPEHVKENRFIERYIEPFIGGGAFFFFLKSKFAIKKAYLFDNNEDLIMAYKVIQGNPNSLITRLAIIETNYSKKDETVRKSYFYRIRNRFNRQKKKFNYRHFSSDWVTRAAHLIFLNKTCFNGLYRLNSNGDFNVPFGRYKNPKILDRKNILEVNRALKDTILSCGDFSNSSEFVTPGTLIYCDPPYRPLNNTSYFTSFTKRGFSDTDQKRLASFCIEVTKVNNDVNLILSNSDPRNQDPNDAFFDELYKSFKIARVEASRMINCDATKRGHISELIITNY